MCVVHPLLSDRAQRCTLIRWVMLAMVVALPAAMLDAQRPLARGFVVDAASRLPIADASITIQSGSDSPSLSTRTDSAGRFRFQVDSVNNLSIVVQKIGFQSMAATVPAAWIGDSVVVPLRTIAVLQGMTTKALAGADRKLDNVGFFERRKAGFGHFLDSAQIGKIRATSAESLLHGYIKGCTMIFVDGIRLLRLSDVDPATIVGVEIYGSNTEAPPEFRNPIENARCGSIVVWRWF